MSAASSVAGKHKTRIVLDSGEPRNPISKRPSPAKAEDELSIERAEELGSFARGRIMRPEPSVKNSPGADYAISSLHAILSKQNEKGRSPKSPLRRAFDAQVSRHAKDLPSPPLLLANVATLSPPSARSPHSQTSVASFSAASLSSSISPTSSSSSPDPSSPQAVYLNLASKTGATASASNESWRDWQPKTLRTQRTPSISELEIDG